MDENGDNVARPEELGGEGEDNWCPWKDSNRTLDFSPAITRLELGSVERTNSPVLTEGRKKEGQRKERINFIKVIPQYCVVHPYSARFSRHLRAQISACTYTMKEMKIRREVLTLKCN